jgi:hypothetical protein
MESLLPMLARRSARAARITSWVLLIGSLALSLAAHADDGALPARTLVAAADASDIESLRQELRQEK